MCGTNIIHGRNRHRRATALMLLASLTDVCLAGCNTVAGVGRDLRAAGAALEGSAERVAGSGGTAVGATEPGGGYGSSSP